jgi:hypothetical protein
MSCPLGLQAIKTGAREQWLGAVPDSAGRSQPPEVHHRVVLEGDRVVDVVLVEDRPQFGEHRPVVRVAGLRSVRGRHQPPLEALVVGHLTVVERGSGDETLCASQPGWRSAPLDRSTISHRGAGPTCRMHGHVTGSSLAYAALASRINACRSTRWCQARALAGRK